MSSAPCYNGPNPVKDEERPVIWKWAKDNAIDRGLPFEKVHDAINQHFFAGQANPKWINDILSGRKTPFKDVSDDMWRARYNRRQVINQAKELYKRQSMTPLARAMDTAVSLPRDIVVGKIGRLDLGHGAAFPLTHAGDLAMNPLKWGTWIHNSLNVWKKMWDPAKAERALDDMQRDSLFMLGIRKGLDVKQDSAPSGYFSRNMTGPSGRAWDMMKVFRFNVWKSEMLKNMTPDMTRPELEEMAERYAIWANEATGSAKGPVASMGSIWFGPKLLQSKLNRVFIRPFETLNTIANWQNATPAEKAVAWTRSAGLTAYALTPITLLAINQGFLKATGQSQNINFTDPSKKDWMSFKVGGLEFSVPGMHSEIKQLAQIMAMTYATNKQLHGSARQQHAAQILGQYILSKATPLIGRAEDVTFGQDFMGRPMPWSSNPGTAKLPRYSWPEYLASLGPIPLTGPIKYFIDHMRKDRESSAFDAMTIAKSFIIYGMGYPGLHVGEDYSTEAQAPIRARHQRHQIAR